MSYVDFCLFVYSNVDRNEAADERAVTIQSPLLILAVPTNPELNSGARFIDVGQVCIQTSPTPSVGQHQNILSVLLLQSKSELTLQLEKQILPET
jgi:hypothetical protein